MTDLETKKRCHRCGRSTTAFDEELESLCIGCAAGRVNASEAHGWLAEEGRLTTLQQVRQEAEFHFPGREVRAGSYDALTAFAMEIRQAVDTLIPRHEPASPDLLLRELIFHCVNFCYWEGRAAHKPAGGGANLMFRLLTEVFRTEDSFAGRLAGAQRAAQAGFPLAPERRECLAEIVRAGEAVISDFLAAVGAEQDIEALLDRLTVLLPAFGSDPFLKRALLFFHCCNRRFGLYRHTALLPAPIDYHVPNILRRRGVLEYAPELADAIERGELIPAGSERELEIRAGALCLCHDLAALAKVNEGEVDDYLWWLRKTTGGPHHLTITTDY